MDKIKTNDINDGNTNGYTYVVSDIHGCYEKLMSMLDKVNFSNDDILYIIGDTVDRGDDGINVLQYIMNHDNIIPLMGNHDYSAYIYLKNMAMPHDGYEIENMFSGFQDWLNDGGMPTFEKFMVLPDVEKNRILTYIKSMEFSKEITVNNIRYLLCHTVSEKERFRIYPLIPRKDYILGEPEYGKQYFDDRTIITGHTPTAFIDENYRGRIWKGNNHIAIDCGAVFGNSLGCICLDTMKEYYEDRG